MTMLLDDKRKKVLLLHNINQKQVKIIKSVECIEDIRIKKEHQLEDPVSIEINTLINEFDLICLNTLFVWEITFAFFDYGIHNWSYLIKNKIQNKCLLSEIEKIFEKYPSIISDIEKISQKKDDNIDTSFLKEVRSYNLLLILKPIMILLSQLIDVIPKIDNIDSISKLYKKKYSLLKGYSTQIKTNLKIFEDFLDIESKNESILFLINT